MPWYLATDGSAEFLIDESSRKYYPQNKPCDPTLNQLCEYCDQEAENANYHQFIGAHKQLGDIIVRNSNDTTAKKVMMEIADCGGLHELTN